MPSICVRLAVGQVVQRIDPPRVARPQMRRVQDPVERRVARLMFSEAMSIFALSTLAPFGIPPRACARRGQGSPSARLSRGDSPTG